MTFFVIIIGYSVFLAVFTTLGVLIDFISYRRARRNFEKVFGSSVGQSFRVVEQNETRGSILENDLSLGDVYTEHGIISFGFKKGDIVGIEPFPKFRPFTIVSPKFLKK